MYDKKVIDHFNNPRNVGSLDKNNDNVGTGIVGAPECGDVMKLQIKTTFKHECKQCHNMWLCDKQESSCGKCSSNSIEVNEIIEDAKFKTFGCGSAIASSSLATEWLKNKTLDEATKIKNTDIVEELSLPPVKIHCSILAEDAIKAAIEDLKKKKGRLK